MFPNLANMLSNAQPFFLSGATPLNLIASGFAQIKSALGILFGLTINTGGTTSACSLYDGTSDTVTITIATPGVVSWPAHPFVAGGAVKFSTTGALPTGLVVGTTYYVSTAGLAAGSFRVADTQAHALAGTNTVNTSGSQSGVQTGWDVSNPIGTYGTTTQGNLPVGLIGARFNNGLIAYATDGGGAANLTVTYI